MSHRMIQLLLLLTLASSATTAWPDQLTMADGSVINGRIIRTQDDSVVIKTRFAGTLVVSIEEVVALRTDEPVTVLLGDGQLLRDQSIQSRDDRLLMSGLDSVTTEAEVVDIERINPAPWEMGIGYGWSGEVSVAVKSERGNTDTDDNTLQFDTGWRSLDDRYTVRGWFDYSKRQGEVSKDKWNIIGKYDRFTPKDHYWGWNVSMEQDKFANLDGRFFTGPYIGKQWFDQQELDLETELGVVSVTTDYIDNDPKRGNNDSFPGISWSLRASSQILGLGSKVYFHNMVIWNATESADAKINNTVGINFDLIKGLLTSAEYVYDWDNKATKFVNKVDQSLNVRVGYQW
jgi:putative salt-induced outer membrane protein YdiY